MNENTKLKASKFAKSAKKPTHFRGSPVKLRMSLSPSSLTSRAKKAGVSRFVTKTGPTHRRNGGLADLKLTENAKSGCSRDSAAVLLDSSAYYSKESQTKQRLLEHVN